MERAERARAAFVATIDVDRDLFRALAGADEVVCRTPEELVAVIRAVALEQSPQAPSGV